MIKTKSYLMILILIILSLLIIVVIPSYSYGNTGTSYERFDGSAGGTEPTGSDPIDNPDFYKPGGIADTDATILTEKVKPIINAISIFGVVVAVITLIVLGIKYMVGSVNEKAEYKKTMFFYLIGVVFLVCIVTILQLINSLVVPLMETV